MFMKDIPAEYTELLRDLNAHDVPFFERNIYGHLEGVYRVLKSWRADDDLAVAGLFHAIYLTDFFECNQPDQNNRSQIRAVIGDVAEELAYWYCVMDRIEFVTQVHDNRFTDSYSGSVVALSKEEDRKLVELIWANAIEQLITADRMFEDQKNLVVWFEASRHRVGSNATTSYESLL
jgi:hypothetical protein